MRVSLLKIVLLVIVLAAVVIISMDGLAMHFSNQEKRSASLITVIDKELSRQKNVLLNQKDVIQSAWLHTLNPLVKKVRGRVIWSNEKQSGVAVFYNLPETPEGKSYRLWVYDLENMPVSGSHFILKNGSTKEILQQIKTDRIIKQPYKFELVLEKDEYSSSAQLLLAQP